MQTYLTPSNYWAKRSNMGFANASAHRLHVKQSRAIAQCVTEVSIPPSEVNKMVSSAPKSKSWQRAAASNTLLATWQHSAQPLCETPTW